MLNRNTKSPFLSPLFCHVTIDCICTSVTSSPWYRMLTSATESLYLTFLVGGVCYMTPSIEIREFRIIISSACKSANPASVSEAISSCVNIPGLILLRFRTYVPVAVFGGASQRFFTNSSRSTSRTSGVWFGIHPWISRPSVVITSGKQLARLYQWDW